MRASIPVICSYCGVGCSLELSLNEDGQPVKSGCSGRNPDVNGSFLCIKGASLHQMLTSPDRLKTPQLRKGGVLQNVSWDEAYSEAGRRLKSIVKEHGPDSVGMLCSGKILNEEAYLSQKFQRTIIGNNNIDNCARLCHGPSEVALRKQLGFGAVSTFLEDFGTTETVVIVGAHTDATYPVIWMKLRKRAKKKEIDLVVADPRKTGLAVFSKVHLQPRPGTDIYWIKALGKIIWENGWHDEAFCRNKALGFQAYLNSIREIDIAAACAKSGVSSEDLMHVAELIRNKKVIFIWGMGLTQHAQGTDNATALVNLALLTGNIGKPGCGVSPLRGQNNVQGACDMGALPNVLPGHMHLGDEAARKHIGAIWNINPPQAPGLSAPEMIHQIADRKIRALYVIGENPTMSEPQSNFVSWMLQSLDLLIVQDIFPTDTARFADILLPAAAVGEKEGTFTNSARRVQFTHQGLTPPGSAKPDWRILKELAQTMGHDWQYDSANDIWEEIRSIAPIFTGITHERLKNGNGLFWPCYVEGDEGTPRLYEDGFAFRDRRARFFPVRLPEQLMEATPEYPFVLITGRLMEHFNTGEMSRRAPSLIKKVSESFVEINSADIAAQGLAEGERVRITSPYGAITTVVRVSDSIPDGYLFAPNHFNKPNYNALMSSVPLDPQARMPALKVVPVNLAPLSAQL